MVDKPTIDLRGLHRVIAMMAEDLDEFCRLHSIQYYLMGGTALGAIRNGGFIPWDDDFDVFMDYENYMKFLACAKIGLDPDKYYLQLEDTSELPLFFSKIRLNNSRYLETDTADKNMHQGIFIDVMCLNNAFTKSWQRRLQFYSARILSAAALARRGYQTSSLAKKVAMKLTKFTCVGPVKWALLAFVRKGAPRNSPLVGHFFGRAPFRATTFPRTFLGEGRYVPFETLCLPVPQNVEGYLSTRFGEHYMLPPSKAVRESFPSHAIAYDLGSWDS